MKISRWYFRLIVVIAGVLTTPSIATAQDPLRSYSDAFEMRFDRTQPIVRYTVRVMPSADSLGYHVTMSVTNAPAVVRIAIPVWSPGAYRIANFYRYIKNVSATADGRSLAVTRQDSSTWRVTTAGTAIIDYDVRYPTVTAAAALGNYAFYRPDGMLLGAPMTYLYIVGATHIPSHVTFELPAGWSLASGLEPTADPRTFFAPSYDILIDCPVLMGARLHLWPFEVDGVPHRIAYYTASASVPFDSVGFVSVHRRIVTAARHIMGRLPYREYTFIYEDGSGGGLEHLNSATMRGPSQELAHHVNALQSLTAHEFFHAWNVKRVRPVELGPFHYDRATRTTSLWWAEGVTDYFAAEILRRAGLRDENAARLSLLETIDYYLNTPGHDHVSPERASFTTWDPNTVNGGYSMSYYATGALIGEMLDLKLRDATNGARGMDDVERTLFDRYAGRKGYTRQNLRDVIQQLCRCSMDAFFSSYVSGTRTFDLDAYLQLAGWHLVVRHVATDSLGHQFPDLRASITPRNGPGSLGGLVGGLPRLALSVPNGSFGKAGLVDGDFITRVNSMPIAEPKDFAAILARAKVGDTLTVAYLRAGVSRTTTVTILPYERVLTDIVDLPTMTAKQRMVRAAWLSGKPVRQ